MSTNKEYIEIRRVVSGGTDVNTGSRPEVIEAENVKSFRAWNKGAKDQHIQGDMTILVMSEEKTFRNGEKKVVTILIEESYRSFLERMSAKVVIKTLAD